MNRVPDHLAHYETSTPNHHWENSLLYSQDKSWVNWPSYSVWNLNRSNLHLIICSQLRRIWVRKYGVSATCSFWGAIFEMRPLRKLPRKAATLFHIFHLDAPLPGATAFANARSGVACCHRRLKNKKPIVRGIFPPFYPLPIVTRARTISPASWLAPKQITLLRDNFDVRKRANASIAG